MAHDDYETANLLPVGIAPEDQVEDSALALLRCTCLSPELIEKLSKSGVASKSRKVKLAIVRHSKAPRYVSLSMLRHLFTFDLMQVALTPAVAGDLKMAAEEVLMKRLENISSGEKLSLAHRASGRVASALLLDAEARIAAAALENARLTEALVTKVLLRNEASPALVLAVCAHPKWSLRREIRITLLRNRHTPARCAIEFARSMPGDVVKEILRNSRLSPDIKASLTTSGNVSQTSP
ncbi:MAG: hypothetical protein WAL32_02810 [Terriglobales bacterium]